MQSPPILPSPSAAPQKKRRGKLIWFFAALGILLVLVLFFALKKKEPVITVQTEMISRHTITETVVANGKVYPVKQVHISAEVSGEIIELDVKEGQVVHKGDLLLKINPKTPLAFLNQSKASYQSSLASVTTANANLEKALADFKRNKELFDSKLISESDYIGYKVSLDIARAQLENAGHSVELAKAAVDSAQDSLDKTTITAPLDGIITTLNSQLGERVLGTVQNAGTDVMIISDLSQMEARVDIGEMDVVLLQAGQKAKLEVDSFKDKKFAGVVTSVANSSEGLNASSSLGGSGGSSSSGQSATQFQVRIRFAEGELFRPGMSVSATIETRTRTNVLAAPIASVTTRVVKPATNSVPTNAVVAAGSDTNSAKADKKADDRFKPVEVIFIVEGDHVKTAPVKIGISDDMFWEITDGLKDGDEIVTGGFKAIGRDLDDGKKIAKGTGVTDTAKFQP